MKRFFAVPLLIVLAFGSLTPQDLLVVQQKIRQSVDSRDYAAAIRELRSLQTANEKAFVADNYDYLLARMAEKNGQLAVAMSNYQAVANRDSILKAYAWAHMSQIARSTGNLLLERIYLNEILLFSPDSLIAGSAMLRLARESLESENYSETIHILTGGIRFRLDLQTKTSAKDPVIRENQALLAEAYSRSGQTERAREILTNLLDTMPNSAQPDDVALTAVKGVDLLDSDSQDPPRLTEEEHLRRARVYQFNRDFADAKLHFDALIANYPAGANTADAMFQIGRGYAQQANYVEALASFERVLEQYPASAAAKDALLLAGAAYARVGKPREAIKRYQSFIDKYPSDEKVGRAYLNIVDVLRDQGEDSEALKWCNRTEDIFRGRETETVAVFAEARIYAAKDDWQNALNAIERLERFADLGGSATPGGTNRIEVTFLKAFSLEQLKRYSEALDSYLTIPDGRGEYYGWRATERLKMFENDETANSFVAQKVGILTSGLKAKDADTRLRNSMSILRLTESPELRERALEVLRAAIKILPQYERVPNFKLPVQNKKQGAPDATHQKIGQALLSLGLYDEAAPEIEASMPAGVSSTDNTTFALATYYERGDRGDRAVGFIEPVWRKIPADYPIELIPRDQLEMLYPAPYVDALLKFAPERGVDPRFVLAIMRQESRFQPDAKSFSAARGLMQFVSTTSTQIAGELGRNNFGQNDLYYPPIAILFGLQYLADLFKSFPGEPDAVAASYNGGDDNMKRWLIRSRASVPERYVPEIVYAQSKDYVYKVMANYRMYQFLYDENLRTR